MLVYVLLAAALCLLTAVFLMARSSSLMVVLQCQWGRESISFVVSLVVLKIMLRIGASEPHSYVPIVVERNYRL